MTNRPGPGRRALFPIAVALAVAAVPAPHPAGAQDLPPADSLIARYVDAIGGAEAHGAPTSIRTTGILSMPAMGLEGEFELLQFPSRGSRMASTLPGVGEMLVGFDGEVGWSMNAMTGPALMSDEELEQTRERSLLAATLRAREVVPERETVERTEMGDEACWRVRLVWRSGRVSHDCYSVETGLLVGSEDVQVSQMGEIPVTTLYAEYEEFHGMRIPTRLVQETMGMQQVMRIESVVIDDATPDALEPPPAIRTLLDDPDGGSASDR